MSYKTFTNLSVFLIIPILIYSLGSGLTSSTTRVYTSSGPFALSILLGSLVTSNFYSQYYTNRNTRRIFILIFGLTVPVLYIILTSNMYSTGEEGAGSMLYFFVTLIGIIEFILYIAIFFILILRVLSRIFNKIFSYIIETKGDTFDDLIKYSWIPAEVNTNAEHITLFYEDPDDEEQKEPLAIAYVGEPINGLFHVKFFIEATTIQSKAAIAAAQRELNFYLIEKGGPDPWSYAKYHCTTAANIYSKIHWAQAIVKEAEDLK